MGKLARKERECITYEIAHFAQCTKASEDNDWAQITQTPLQVIVYTKETPVPPSTKKAKRLCADANKPSGILPLMLSLTVTTKVEKNKDTPPGGVPVPASDKQRLLLLHWRR